MGNLAHEDRRHKESVYALKHTWIHPQTICVHSRFYNIFPAKDATKSAEEWPSSDASPRGGQVYAATNSCARFNLAKLLCNFRYDGPSSSSPQVQLKAFDSCLEGRAA